MIPDRLNAYRNAPMGELLSVLLSQLRRPLAAHGLDLTDADCDEIGQQIAEHSELGERGDQLRAALNGVIDESAAVLAAWGLHFEEAIKTGVDALPGWETTADFLEVATEKTNAELRISTGVALLTAAGDSHHIGIVKFLASGKAGEDSDVEAIIAQRILGFVK